MTRRRPRQPGDLRVIKLPIPEGMLWALREEARRQSVPWERLVWTCLRLGLKRTVQLREAEEAKMETTAATREGQPG